MMQDFHDSYRAIITALIFIILFDDWGIYFCFDASCQLICIVDLFGAWYWKEFSNNLWLFNCNLNCSFMSLFNGTFAVNIFLYVTCFSNTDQVRAQLFIFKMAVNLVQ